MILGIVGDPVSESQMRPACKIIHGLNPNRVISHHWLAVKHKGLSGRRCLDSDGVLVDQASILWQSTHVLVFTNSCKSPTIDMLLRMSCRRFKVYVWSGNVYERWVCRTKQK